MRLLDGTNPQPKEDLYTAERGRFRVIANPSALYHELLLKVSLAKDEETLNDIKEFVNGLKLSAGRSWYAFKSDKDLEEAKKVVPESLASRNMSSPTPALEGGAFYIPDMTMVEGSVEARIAINSWKADLANVQSRVYLALNRFSLNNPKISETEQKTSNVFNQLMFFLTNDPDEHGKILEEKAYHTKDIAEMKKYVTKLKENLMLLNDFDKGTDNCCKCNTLRESCGFNKGMSFMKWRCILDGVLSILSQRDREEALQKEKKVYVL